MSNLRLCIAVTAFGSIEEINDGLESIGAQHIDSSLELNVLVVHHDDSINDVTVGKAINSEQIKFKLIQQEPNDPKIMRCEALSVIAENLADDIDWVWCLESGHSLYSRNSMSQVASIIREKIHSRVHLIHCSDAERSFDTGYSQIKPVMDLCDEFGYLEILGKQPSFIIRRTQLQYAFGKHLSETANKAVAGKISLSSHTQAQFLYLALSCSDGCLVDLKLINQNQSYDRTSPMTVSEWFNVARELSEVSKALESEKKWAPHFFRSGETNLWCELVMRQGFIAATFNERTDESSAEMTEFIQNWQSLLELAELVDNQEAYDAIYSVVTSGIKLTIDFLKSSDGDNGRLGAFFAEQAGASRIYPATLFRADYLMGLLKQSA